MNELSSSVSEVPESKRSRLENLQASNGPASNKSREPQIAQQNGASEGLDGLPGVYIISVAARILEMHPQTLRKYERLGLITPYRTVGMLRLYSWEDIQKLRLIRYLMDTLGLNLAGVELAMGIVDNLVNLNKRLGESAEGTPFKKEIQQEINQIFRNLNLPIETS